MISISPLTGMTPTPGLKKLHSRLSRGLTPWFTQATPYTCFRELTPDTHLKTQLSLRRAEPNPPVFNGLRRRSGPPESSGTLILLMALDGEFSLQGTMLIWLDSMLRVMPIWVFGYWAPMFGLSGIMSMMF